MKWDEIKQTADCRCCKGTGKTYDHREIGRTVKDARKAAGLKLWEVHRGSGYSISYICDLEQGRKPWSSEPYEKIMGAILRLIKSGPFAYRRYNSPEQDEVTQGADQGDDA